MSATDGAVRLSSTAENGADLGSTSVRADVVVGADGVNSVVRSTGGFESGVSLGNSYVRSIVRVGPARGSKSIGLRWDPSARRR